MLRMKFKLNRKDIYNLVNESIHRILESYMLNKPYITILWLDDQREPNSYFQKELEKIKGTIFLIFDDNVSGGATLSDICYQCKQLGIENIIPITFGRMQQSNNMRGIVLNTPKNGYDFS